MTIIQIKLKDAYVNPLLAIIAHHTEIPIENIVIEGACKNDYLQKQQKKQNLMRIAQACANLPTIDHHSADQILGYQQSEMGLWGND